MKKHNYNLFRSMPTLFAGAVLLLSTTIVSAQSWIMQNVGFKTPGANPFQISVVDANVVWASAANGLVTSFNNEVSHTTNGGNTWQCSTITAMDSSYGIASIAGIDANTAFVVTGSIPAYGSTIYKTNDGGNNWATVSSGLIFNNATSFATRMHFWNAAHGIIIGDPISTPMGNKFEVYTTVDSGITWSNLPAVNIPNAQAGDFTVPKTFEFKGSCIWFSTYNGELFKSKDYGQHWSIANSSLGFGFISFLDDTLTGIAQTGFGTSTIQLTTDGGSTWIQPATTGPVYFMVRSIPGTNVFLSFSGPPNDPYNFGSSFSTDLGSTWIPIDTFGLGTTNGYGWMEFKDINTGWACGISQDSLHDGIYKWNPGILGINDDHFNSTQLSVYPNPATNKIFLKGIASKSSLQLFDLTGTIILEKKENISDGFNKEVEMDVNNIPSGMYLIKATNGVHSSQAKVVVR